MTLQEIDWMTSLIQIKVIDDADPSNSVIVEIPLSEALWKVEDARKFNLIRKELEE